MNKCLSRVALISTLAVAYPALSAQLEPNAENEAVVMNAVDLYAKHAGTIASCEMRSRESDVRDMARKVSEWARPGILDGLLGRRAEFEERAAARIMLVYSQSKLKVCGSKMDLVLAKQLASTAKGMVDRVIYP